MAPGVTFSNTIEVKLPNGSIVTQNHSEAAFFDSVQETHELDAVDAFYNACEDSSGSLE